MGDKENNTIGERSMALTDHVYFVCSNDCYKEIESASSKIIAGICGVETKNDD